ncbi:MAG TPA: rhomboid family intramembrane serine protease [Flavisolibacter sp.]|nr:rhomboid family intramembrane serine protease [Flavisolibacter sp.]
MSYYQQRNRGRLTIGQDGNTLVMLIAVQLVVFVLFSFIKIIYFFTDGQPGVELYKSDILSWFILPSHLPTLLTRPWTLITHFFIHDNVWHLLGNMLWLWGFGHIFQDLSGNRKVIPVFLYGALAGAFFFILAYNVIPVLAQTKSPALGASAGVMAIAIATTVMAPGYRIFPMLNGGIPLWVITTIYVIIDLAMITVSNTGGHIAHLAGAAAGFVFVIQLQKGRDGSIWINNFFDWVTNLFNPEKPKRGKVVKSQLFYKSNVAPFKKTTTNLSQQRVDEILDKINQKGYNTLSAEEKEILKRASSEDL